MKDGKILLTAVAVCLIATTRTASQTIPSAPAPAASPQRTIWGFFGLSRSNVAECRTKLSRTQLGSLLGNALKPVSLFTGGLIGSDLTGGGAAAGASPGAGASAGAPGSGPTGAQATAAKIQQYQAQAKATIASIDYLATVDCHYWPEAEKALIEALRANRVECVRYAAARALEGGCCCTKKTIDALRIVVDGSEEDGNPSETSPRVRSSAFRALQRCLCASTDDAGDVDASPAPLEPPVPALDPLGGGISGAAARPSAGPRSTNVSSPPADRQVVASAWRSLATASQRGGWSDRRPRGEPGRVAPPASTHVASRDDRPGEDASTPQHEAGPQTVPPPSARNVLIVVGGPAPP